MSLAYAYVRYSTARQGAEGRDSETRQTAPLAAFEQAFDISIDERNIVYDRGRSAFDGSNALKGNLKALLEKLREDDFLVVESIDRLTRQRVLNGVELIQNLLKRGIKLYTTSDKKLYEISDPSRDLETLLLISVIAKRANEESETKSIRRKSAYQHAKNAAAESGKIFNKNTPPYGIRFDSEAQKFVEDKEEADEIREIFSSLRTFGLTETLKRVNKTSKRRWSNRAVEILIQNKSPLGTLAVYSRLKKDGKEKRVFERFIDNYYPQIVSETDFFGAIEAMKKRKTNHASGRTTKENVNIFKKAVLCAKCNGTMLFSRTNLKANEKGYTYLICRNKRELGNCDAENINFDYALGSLFKLNEIALAVNSHFEKLNIPHNRLVSTSSLFLKLAKEKSKSSKNDFELTSKLKQRSEKENQLKNITSSLDFNAKIPSFLVQQMSKLEQEIEELNRQVATLNLSFSSDSNQNLGEFIDLKSLVSTEEGRIKVNRFFVDNGILFKFLTYKDSATGEKVIATTVLKKDDNAINAVLSNIVSILELQN